MKNECIVIKDLLPSYIAGILSSETEKSINEHIEHCEKCKKMLEEMEVSKQNTANNAEEKIELDYLKKYNKKMKILKAFILSIVLLVILFSSVFIVKYNYIANIMEKVSNNIQEIEKQNNYMVTVTEHRIDYERKNNFSYITKHYYKDNKYKTENHSLANVDLENNDTYDYGEIDSNNRISIIEDTKTAYKESRNYAYMKKEYLLRDIKNVITIFDTDFGIFQNLYMTFGYQIRTDRYNGKECFVLKATDNQYYVEYWIEKDSLMLVRTIQDIYNRIYTENTYEVTKDTVKDEDLVIPNLDGYKVEETNANVNDELLKIYNNVF